MAKKEDEAKKEPQETQGAPQRARKRSEGTNTARKAKKPAKKATGAKKKGAGGRRKLYDVLKIKMMLDTVRGWASEGATIKELAEILNVAESTIYKWQKEEPEFAEALRAGRHVSNGELIASAMRQSLGGMQTLRKAVKVKDWEYKTAADDPDEPGIWRQVEKVIIVEEDYYIEPNANITMFMLANRMPTRYKKQHHVEHAGSVANGYEHMTNDDLDAEIAALESLEQNPGRKQPPAH